MSSSKIGRLVASTPGYDSDGYREFNHAGIMQMSSGLLILLSLMIGIGATLLSKAHSTLQMIAYSGVFGIALAALLFLLAIRPIVRREREWEFRRWVNRHTNYHLAIMILSGGMLSVN
jgi:hypothetical protein